MLFYAFIPFEFVQKFSTTGFPTILEKEELRVGSISKRGIFSPQETETLDEEQVGTISLRVSFSP
jgi:hypothetical protein